MKPNWSTNPSSRAPKDSRAAYRVDAATTRHRKLGEVCEINMGQSPASSTYNKEKIGLPFYQGKKDYGEKYPTPRVWCSEPMKIVEDGDILISVRAPVGALNVAKEKSCIGRGLAGLRGKANLEQDYLFHFLKLKEKEIADLGTGSTFTAISKKHLENIEIPLPSLSEQKKIVAKLERVLRKIGEAKKLRAEARENADNLLPAELHKIFTLRHSNILQNVGMSSESKNDWQEKELKEVVEQKTVKNTKRNLPFVGMEDVESETGRFLGSLEPRSVKSTTFHFNKDSVLYGKLRPYLNKVLLPDFEGHCSTEFIPLKPKEGISREWIAYWLKSPQTVDGAMSTNTGSRMPRANMKDLMKFKIPLPPLAEQKRIVKHLDSLSQKLRKLQEYQKSTQSDLLTFEQAILQKAFSPSPAP